MGLFTVSLAKKDRELLKELIRLVKAMRNQELVVNARFRDRDAPSVSTDFGVAGDSAISGDADTTYPDYPEGT